METSRAAARQALSETAERLRRLDVVDVDQEMILDAITPYPQTFKTSIGREVSFLMLATSQKLAITESINFTAMVRVLARYTPLVNGRPVPLYPCTHSSSLRSES
jgi:hypothetical protein